MILFSSLKKNSPPPSKPYNDGRTSFYRSPLYVEGLNSACVGLQTFSAVGTWSVGLFIPGSLSTSRGKIRGGGGDIKWFMHRSEPLCTLQIAVDF